MITPDASRLTRRQRDVLAALQARAEADAPPPSLDALCAALGVRSRGSMHKHVEALRAAGWVAPSDGLHRGIRLAAPPPAPGAARRLPMLGRIAAGRPIEAIERADTVEVPGWLDAGDDAFVLQVHGDSMIDDGILDGDWVVVRRADEARNGDVVVALVDGSEATLKRIEQRPGACLLHPANGTMAALAYAPERVIIQGVLVAQIRRY